jgi:prepilin-type N-terminal cleavage/methylation domain-containing protein
MKLLRSQAGFTITEIMVVIAISGFLMAVAATGFSAFFAKEKELHQIMELQRDAFNCLQTIKNGIPIRNENPLKFQGVATADSIKFVGINSNKGSEIILYPPGSNIDHVTDYVRIWWDGWYVRATYLNFNYQPPGAYTYLFPAWARNPKIKVTKLEFSQANVGEPIIKVINVTLEAQLVQKDKDPKKVSYTTKMALSL